MFFNPKLKQTKVWQVELKRLNDRNKTTYTSVFPLQKSVERDKKKEKKIQEHCHKHSMNIFTVRTFVGAT